MRSRRTELRLVEPMARDGFTAPLRRALFEARLVKGLPRNLAAVWWGLWLIPSVAFGIWWVLILAVAGHALMARLGRKNPYWVGQLKAALKLPRFLR
jgi:hypothetical protein